MKEKLKQYIYSTSTASINPLLIMAKVVISAYT